MFGLGAQELFLILVIVFIFFGATRIPQLGSSLAKGISNFKKGIKSDPDEDIDVLDDSK